MNRDRHNAFNEETPRQYLVASSLEKSRLQTDSIYFPYPVTPTGGASSFGGGRTFLAEGTAGTGVAGK